MTNDNKNIDKNESSQGWEKRSITDAHKVKDQADTYKSLGFEVLIKTYDSKAHCESECDTCLKDAGEQCKVIFTRSKPNETGDEEKGYDFEDLEDE